MLDLFIIFLYIYHHVNKTIIIGHFYLFLSNLKARLYVFILLLFSSAPVCSYLCKCGAAHCGILTAQYCSYHTKKASVFQVDSLFREFKDYLPLCELKHFYLLGIIAI